MPAPIKWWDIVRWQQVVDHFRGKILFVQVGDTSHNHRPLRGVLDLRGKTDLRQLVRLVHHADGVLCGTVGCHPIDWSSRNCSLGYWIDAAHEGRGVITRCCGVMLDHVFDELGLHRAEIRCGTGNQRSCAVPQRLGFTREGVAREAEWVNDRWVDLVVWAILEEEWRRKRPRA